MTEFTEQEVLQKISDLIAEAQNAVWEAEILADKYNVKFSMCLGDYGMGGYYNGEIGDWQSSSASC